MTAITVTDQFCGAGGSTTGAAQVPGVEVRLAMNHWALALETHNTNHPNVDHALADISQADPRYYPTTDILITSPECTSHSLAKGRARKNQGQLELWGNGGRIDPAEERSRATMWDVPRFAEVHDYKLIIVENVVDARYWRLWDSWLHAMQSLDYDWQIVYLNSMFALPTPQSRDRMYVVFWKRGNRQPDLNITPDAYCDHCGQTVAAYQSWKKSIPWGRYRKQYLYRCPICRNEVQPHYYPAAAAIDWTDLGQRVGDRDKPLKPKTLERIRYGLEKYGAAPALTQVDYTQDSSARTRPVSDPLPTQTGRQVFALSAPQPFVLGYYTRRNPAVNGVDEPLPTQSAQPRHYLAVPQPFIAELRRTGKARSVSEALATVTAGGNHHGLVVPPFLTSYYSSAHQATPVSEPVGTVTTVDRHGLVTPGEELRVEDCHFRMLKPVEIQAAMAFPGDYVVLGNNREQVKQLGNAVTPPAMRLLVERCAASLA